MRLVCEKKISVAAAVLLLAVLLAQPAAGRKKPKNSYCDNFAPLPSEVRKHLPKVAKAITKNVCGYLGAKPPPRRLSLNRWTDEASQKLGPVVKLIETQLRMPGMRIHNNGACYQRDQTQANDQTFFVAKDTNECFWHLLKFDGCFLHGGTSAHLHM